MESFGNALNIFISITLRLLYLRSSQSSAVMFANVSTVTELTLQFAISGRDKEYDLMKLLSLGV